MILSMMTLSIMALKITIENENILVGVVYIIIMLSVTMFSAVVTFS